jgi:nitrogen-specific signal transduction histidine kinase
VIAGTLVDITAQLELERRLVESQQLEMLGQLAGGIAHNFNNLLAIVTGYADLLGPLVADRPDAAGFVHAISEAAERSATLTQQLLALTRSRTSTPVATDAGALATRVAKLMTPLIGARLTLRSEVPRIPAIVQIDPGQLEQVLMNLVLNARDAIATVGQIHVDVRAVTLASPVPARPKPVPAGRWVVLEVRDDGTGMGPDVQARAFEPFFSTREPGRGTGLGLSTCLAIVARAGGALQLASSPGTGTTVSVWLPSHAPGPVPAAKTAPQPGGRRALVIDDQKAVADLLLRVLLRAGWDAEAASDAEAALAAAARLARLDLVVSDVMIPGLRGPGILERIREFHPDVAAVFVSGYTADALTTAGTLPPGTRFVEKPFRPIDLVQAAELALADRVRSGD